MITASVTIIPKTTPTMMNRLFISKIETSQLKRDAIELGKELE
jgi:hypothetical protein